jgi:hypothetical protein
MKGRRDILISALLVGIQVGAPTALFVQPVLAQPGGSSANVPAVPPDSGLRARLQTLVPTSGTSAQLMVIQSDFSAFQIQQRVVQAGGDLKVLDSVLGQVQQGDLSSYDERLGISRTEFRNMLVFRRTLKPSSKQVRMVISQSGTRLVFGDISGASILRGISIDFQSGELSTQDGFTARPRGVQISATQDGTGMGASTGIAWDIKGSNPRTLNAINGHLSLLQFNSGQVLLSYRRVSLIKAHISEESVNLLYRK